jgi:rare lipoprotein A
MLGLVAVLLVSQLPLEHVADGVASYYTVASSGSRTASGDPLDDKMYTCAMRKAELGSYVLVVADNGGSVICRVNDRGPFVRGRVVDLSEAAMRSLAVPASSRLTYTDSTWTASFKPWAWHSHNSQSIGGIEAADAAELSPHWTR